MGGRKITGSPRAELEEFWGRSTAKKDILSDANVDQHLSNIIEASLLAPGRRTMKDCIPSLSPYNHVATAINNLGWDCFVEGRILYVLIDTIKPMLRRYIPKGSV